MSKRKKPDSEVPTGAEDIEINEALLGFDDDAADGLPGDDGLPGEDGFDESELGDLEDALGDEEEDDDGEEGDDGGEEEDDGDGDGDDGGGELPPETEDDATLPVDASELESGEEVDLSAHTLSTAQARLIAPHLVQNGDLAKLKLATSTLSISDLKEDDELEWDSEEYTDVEAIIIAECALARAILFRAQFRAITARVTASHRSPVVLRARSQVPEGVAAEARAARPRAQPDLRRRRARALGGDRGEHHARVPEPRVEPRRRARWALLRRGDHGEHDALVPQPDVQCDPGVAPAGDTRGVGEREGVDPRPPPLSSSLRAQREGGAAAPPTHTTPRTPVRVSQTPFRGWPGGSSLPEEYVLHAARAQSCRQWAISCD